LKFAPLAGRSRAGTSILAAAISEDEVSAVDLCLDLFVFPDGRTLLLDEDEYGARGPGTISFSDADERR
jgi:predicted RNA-binding protein associated with RNAse of E/G family